MSLPWHKRKEENEKKKPNKLINFDVHNKKWYCIHLIFDYDFDRLYNTLATNANLIVKRSIADVTNLIYKL